MGENSEQEELAYIISHDLQEPIRMINSYVKLLEKKYKNVLDKEAIDYINYAVDGVSRLKSMVDDLLRYSRVSKENLNKSWFKITDITESVFKHLKKKHKNAEFEIDNSLDLLPEIFADRNQISQLFLNIAENSIKFNLNQHKLITVKHLSAIGYLKLCITDNGIGIDNQYNEKIFRIFQKLHNHTEYPGSGIGLAICKKIIENHNGQIWLESELGKGTKFYFSIPIVT